MKGLKETKVMYGYTRQWEKQMRWGRVGRLLGMFKQQPSGKEEKEHVGTRGDEEKELR